MKFLAKLLFTCSIIFASNSLIVGQNNGDYRSKQSGKWGYSSTWEVYNSSEGTWDNASSGPGSNIAITIQNEHTVTNGNVNRGITGVSLTVNGVFHIDDGTFRVYSSSTVNVNGLLKQTGTLYTYGSVNIENNGIYQYNRSNINEIPEMTWNDGSTCEITGTLGYSPNDLDGLDQSFYHFKVNANLGVSYFDASGDLQDIRGDLIIINTGSGTKEFRLAYSDSYNLNIGGDLIIEGGTLNISRGWSGSKTINIAGDYIQTGGTFKRSSGSATINFTGINSEFNKTGGTLTTTNISFNVKENAKLTLKTNFEIPYRPLNIEENATLDCETNLLTGTSATFTLNAGATLITAHPEGIANTGSTGSIRVTGTRTFDSGANYEYDGTSAQQTGTGLPENANALIIKNNSEEGLELTNNLICTNLIIDENSKLNLKSNKYLSVIGDLTNNGDLHIESNINGEGSLITQGNISGTGTYHIDRYLAGGQWHLISSPITNGLSGIFEDIWLRPYDESENEFGEYITPITTPMPVGQGFSAWTDADETRTFTGTINHGAIGPLSAQLSGAAGENSGWNLMGNPYPSAIDWDAGSGWTKNNLADAVYVWDETQYATYIAGTGVNGGSRYIASGQGFFVQATSAGASLSMDNDIRVHNSVNFLKNSQSDPDNTIRVTISADGYQDENVIVIREANANAFDPQVDAYKLPGSADAPQMHIKKDDFSKLSIASFPQIQDIEDKVLNIDYALEGSHTLLWSHTCTENTPAILDQQTGQIIEPGSNYTFTASFSDMQDRFVFTTDLLSIQDKFNELDVWEYNNTVFIKSNTNENQISVFNMQGVEVYSNTGNEFDLNHLAPAMYLVKVKSGNNQKIEKIIIK